jgi:surface protein
MMSTSISKDGQNKKRSNSSSASHHHRLSLHFNKNAKDISSPQHSTGVVISVPWQEQAEEAKFISKPDMAHAKPGLLGEEMDCVTMKLVERETGLPLDLVVLINSFLYERLTDENFKQAIALWFEKKEECKFRFGHISDWKTSRVTNMKTAFYGRSNFNEDIGRWNVGRVTNMR